ncbi:hypothetical protein J4467_01125 [Candidatus Woesearchaeota archaeon]|nr:hypothetical protein [Candidatus Woesearchaeota archaeon]
MFNPSMQTKMPGKKNLGIFLALALAVTFGFTFLSKSTITGAAVESGEIVSYGTIVLATIVVLILLSLLWWWLKKK